MNRPRKTQEQKALEILRAMAVCAAKGQRLSIAPDWGFGTATLLSDDNEHIHFGNDDSDTDVENFKTFVDELHKLLVKNKRIGKIGG